MIFQEKQATEVTSIGPLQPHFFKRIVFSIALLAVCLTSDLATAQVGGTQVFSSLSIPASARESALGGAMLAMKDGDLNLCIRNPSLLDSAVAGKVTFGYIDYFAKTNAGVFAYARTISPKLTAAASIQFLSHGQLDETDELGNVIGQFGASDFSAGIGLGYRVDSLFSLGGSVKMVYSSLANYYAAGLLFDLSATYQHPGQNFSASLVLNNIGFILDPYIEGQKSELPVNLAIGIVKRLPHAPLRFNLVVDHLESWQVSYEDETQILLDPVSGTVVEQGGPQFGDRLMRHVKLGAEILFSQNFHFRLGYDYRRRKELGVDNKLGMAGFSYGFGFKLSRFQLSYGRAIYHLAGPSNHFSVSTNIFSTR
ncbi:MAG: type IX secretion system protein PorQ [Flavobacteriales bacterium]|nr:type IX secretion system protein PorQ [Flavobacteriales bacterium]